MTLLQIVYVLVGLVVLAAAAYGLYYIWGPKSPFPRATRMARWRPTDYTGGIPCEGRGRFNACMAACDEDPRNGTGYPCYYACYRRFPDCKDPRLMGAFY